MLLSGAEMCLVRITFGRGCTILAARVPIQLSRELLTCRIADFSFCKTDLKARMAEGYCRCSIPTGSTGKLRWRAIW